MNYRGTILRLNRKLDGKGRLQLPGELREAIGMAPDDEVEVSVVRLIDDNNKYAFMITRKEVGVYENGTA